MRLILLVTLSLISQNIYAGICADAWKIENKTNPVLESCQLEWKGGGIELVKTTTGCSFTKNKPEACFILRSCDARKQMGASVFIESAGTASYCLSNREMEVMGASSKELGQAFITCEGTKKPKSIRLQGQTDKITKTCAFPFIQLQQKP